MKMIQIDWNVIPLGINSILFVWIYKKQRTNKKQRKLKRFVFMSQGTQFMPFYCFHSFANVWLSIHANKHSMFTLYIFFHEFLWVFMWILLRRFISTLLKPLIFGFSHQNSSNITENIPISIGKMETSKQITSKMCYFFLWFSRIVFVALARRTSVFINFVRLYLAWIYTAKNRV